MKRYGKKIFSFVISFLMIFTSLTQYVSAKPASNDSKKEYEVHYLAGKEDTYGYYAQFTISNVSDKAMSDWKFEFDFPYGLEEPDIASISKVNDNRYQFKAKKGYEVLGAHSEMTINYYVNSKRDANSNPQNYNFTYKAEEPKLNVDWDSSAFEYQEPGIYHTNKIPDSLKGTISANYKIKAITYKISVGKMEVDSGKLTEGSWVIKSPKFIAGLNMFEIIVEDMDGQKKHKSYPINSNEENADLDLSDDDKDKIPNWLEVVYGTDKNKPDSDGDKLSDYEEVMITKTDPLLKDSDNNGIEDGDEDIDKDGLNNLEEVAFGSDPSQADVDEDGLNDAKEKEWKTDPNKADSDNDKLSDAREIELGSNPRNPDSNGNGILDGDEDWTVHMEVPEDEKDENVEPSINVTMSASGTESITIKRDNPESSVWMPKEVPGLLGAAYDFEASQDIKEAEISFKFAEKFKNKEDINPQIYYINTETQEMYPLENQEINWETRTVKAKTTHFSKYALIDTTAWEKSWIEDIIIGDQDRLNARIDTTFVIDESGSMSSNDAKKVRVQVAKNFIDVLREKDKVAVVGFESYARLLASLTINHAEVKEALNKITNNGGGTSLSAGVSMGLNQYPKPEIEVPGFPDKDEKSMKIMILLTDGQGTYSDTYTQSAIEKGVKIYTVGLGQSYDRALLERIANETGAKFYHADNAEALIKEFEKLVSESVDIVTDSDNDGLSDYHEERIRLYNGLTIQLDKNDADCDGDSLKDGDEIIQTTDSKGRVFFKMKSHPNMKDSDGDGINDAEDDDPLGFKPRVVSLDEEATFTSFGQTPVITFSPSFTGGYRIHMSGKTTANIEIYKKGFFGGEEITERKHYNGTDEQFNFRAQLKKGTKYYIRIKNVPQGATYRVSLKQNIDKAMPFSDINGGSWKRTKRDNEIGGIDRITYMDAENTRTYYKILDNDKLLDVINKLLNASIGTSSSVIVDCIVSATGIAVNPYIVGLAGAFLFSLIPYGALEAHLDSIMQKSDYLKNGIVAYTYTTYIATQSGPISYSQVIIDKSWDGKFLIGEIGYIGEFDNDIKTLW